MSQPRPGSEKEQRRFAELQQRLRPLYRRVFSDPLAPRTVVVVPSLSLDPDIIARISGAPHYEERMLCLLLLLRMARTHVVYVTSVPIHPTITDYYLHLLAGVPHTHARRRLTLLSANDPSMAPLSAKILAKPTLMRRLRSAIGDPALAHMACFNTTGLERTLAVRLGIPLYGCDRSLAHLGSKSGSRRVFREAGIRMPEGFEDLHTPQDIAAALVALKQRCPDLDSAVVKLNDGFSGEGNACFRYRQSDRGSDLEARLTKRLGSRLAFEAHDETWDRFRDKFASMGGIVEARLIGDEVRSPSAQCRIDPRGHIEVVSTHEQRLGGRSGQVFVGCEFPARNTYRARLQDDAECVARVLRDRGVLGRFSVDFVAVRRGTRWRCDAIEVNLRKGGTTHPFLMLDFLTNGAYDRRTGTHRTRSGQALSYIATDNLQQQRYVGLNPDALVAIAVEQGLHYHAASHEGVVFHLIGALERYGKIGMLCIAADLKRAEHLYARTVEVLDREGGRRARRARLGRTPPRSG